MDSHKSKYQQALDLVPEETLTKWKQQQDELKTKLILSTAHSFHIDNSLHTTLKCIGGMDISVSKHSDTYGIASLVVCDPQLNVLYQKHNFIEITEPYVPGFLAFREVNHLQQLLKDLNKYAPSLYPEVILIDGNGIYHNNGFGLACHLGTLTDTCTIGCSKTVFNVDGINKKKVRDMTDKFTKKGEVALLKGDSGKTWGAAIKMTDDSVQPMIISVGNKIELDTAINVVKLMTMYRVPEPVRLADKISRKLLAEYERRKFTKFDIETYIKQNKHKLFDDLD